jgi:hypothetical protein
MFVLLLSAARRRESCARKGSADGDSYCYATRLVDALALQLNDSGFI